MNSDLDRDSEAVVEGEIRNDAGRLISGFWVIGLLFMVGWAVLAIGAALALAALAPTLARTAGRSITGDPGRTIGAGPVVIAIAAFLGSGALALHTWRVARAGVPQPVPGPAPADTLR